MWSIFLDWLAHDLLPISVVGTIIAFYVQHSGMEVLKRYLAVKLEEEKDRLRRETETALACERNEFQKLLSQFTHQLDNTLEVGKARLDLSKNIAERILNVLVSIASKAAECNAATGGISNDGSEDEAALKLERFTLAEKSLKEAYFSQLVLLDQALFDQCRKYTGAIKQVRTSVKGGDRSAIKQTSKEAHATYRELTSKIRACVAQLASGGIPDVGAILSD